MNRLRRHRRRRDLGRDRGRADATADYQDTDSDNDGYSDRVEAARGYPGFSKGSPAPMCGAAADDCEAAPDTRPNYIDLDSDNHSIASARFAADTNNVPATGSPFVFVGSASATQSQVISAVSAIVGQGRSTVSTTVLPDATETRLLSGRPTGEFIRTVNPLRGVPDAPTGYDRREGATFVGVAIGTTVTFNTVLANDLVMPGAVDQVFTVYVNVNSGGISAEAHTFYVLVPAPR